MVTTYRIRVLGTIVWEGRNEDERIKVLDAVKETLKQAGVIKGMIHYGQAYSENGKMYYDYAWVRFE